MTLASIVMLMECLRPAVTAWLATTVTATPPRTDQLALVVSESHEFCVWLCMKSLQFHEILAFCFTYLRGVEKEMLRSVS